MAKKLKNGLSKHDISRILTYALYLNDISAKDLARRVDVTPSSISGYINGTNLPSEEVWNRICTVLYIPPLNNKESFSFNQENRHRYVHIETKHRRERMKKWIGMLYYLGYSSNEIEEYVDDFVDWQWETVFTDSFNELVAATIMGL